MKKNILLAAALLIVLTASATASEKDSYENGFQYISGNQTGGGTLNIVQPSFKVPDSSSILKLDGDADGTSSESLGVEYTWDKANVQDEENFTAYVKDGDVNDGQRVEWQIVEQNTNYFTVKLVSGDIKVAGTTVYNSPSNNIWYKFQVQIDTSSSQTENYYIYNDTDNDGKWEDVLASGDTGKEVKIDFSRAKVYQGSDSGKKTWFDFVSRNAKKSNSPPSIDSTDTDPNTLNTGDKIDGFVNASDSDGDDLTGSVSVWENSTKINNSISMNEPANNEFELKNIVKADQHNTDYTFQFEISDGTATTKSNVTKTTPVNQNPSVDSIVLSPDPVGAGETVNGSVNVSDSDGFVSNVEGDWVYPNGTVWKNNVVLTNSSKNFDLWYNSQSVPSTGPTGSWILNVSVEDDDSGTGKDGKFFTVEDRKPPKWFNLKDNTTSGEHKQGDPLNFSVEFKDPLSGIEQTLVSINNSGTFSNTTVQKYEIDTSMKGRIGETSLVKKTFDVSNIDSFNITLNAAGGGTAKGDKSLVGSKGGKIKINLNTSNAENVTVVLGNAGEDGGSDGTDGGNGYKGANGGDGSKPDDSDIVAGGAGAGASAVLMDAKVKVLVGGGGGAGAENDYLGVSYAYGGGGGGEAGDKGCGTNECGKAGGTIFYTGSDITGGKGGYAFEGNDSVSNGEPGRAEFIDTTKLEIYTNKTGGGNYDKATASIHGTGDKPTDRILTDYEFKDTSFEGLLGYRFWAKDANNNWNATNVKTVEKVNTPKILGYKVYWYGIGGSENRNITLSLDDVGDKDLKSYSPDQPSGTLKTFTNSTLTVKNWKIGTFFNWTVKVTDTFGETSKKLNTSFKASKDKIKVVNNSDATYNETHQALKTVASVNILGAFNGNLSLSADKPQPLRNTVVNGDLDKTNVSEKVQSEWQWFVDKITSRLFDEKQNTGKDSNLSSQYLQLSKQVENNASTDFEINISQPKMNGTIINPGYRIQDIPANTKLNTSYESRTDNLSETNFDTSYISNSIVLDTNYLSYRPLQVENLLYVNFTEVSTLGTPGLKIPNECARNNNTEIQIPPNSLDNYTTELRCDPGTSGSPTTNKYDAEEFNRVVVWRNTTDAYINSNNTKTEDIIWSIDETSSKLPKWDQRIQGSVEQVVDGKKNKLYFEDQPSKVEFVVPDDFNTGYSLQKGSHSLKLHYRIKGNVTSNGTFETQPTGGGEEKEQVKPNVIFRTSRSDSKSGSIEGFANKNGTTVLNFLISKGFSEETTITLTVPDRPGCQYISLQKGIGLEKFGKQATVFMPVGSGEASSRFLQYKVDMPNKTKIQCQLQVSVTNGIPQKPVITVRSQLGLLARLQKFYNKLPYLPEKKLFDSYKICLNNKNFTELENNSGSKSCKSYKFLTPSGLAVSIFPFIVFSLLLRTVRRKIVEIVESVVGNG